MQGWDVDTAPGIAKVVVCYDSWDEKRVRNGIANTLYTGKDLKYTDPELGTVKVITRRAIQWSWAENLRGHLFNEIIFTKEAWGRSQYLGEELIEAQSRRIKKGDIFLDNSLILPLCAPEAAFSDAFVTDHLTESITDEFYFPVSLFTRTQGYFMDKRSPKKEEFAMAIMMEGISAKTEAERRAIEEATL